MMIFLLCLLFVKSTFAQSCQDLLAANKFRTMLMELDCYEEYFKSCIDGRPDNRCKEVTRTGQNIWIDVMKTECEAFINDESIQAGIYGMLRVTWNGDPIDIECWRVLETYYGCGTLGDQEQYKTCGLQPQLIRSQVITERPNAGCTRSGIDVEVALDARVSTNCLYPNWFNTFQVNIDYCKELENNFICNAAIGEWGTADCHNKFKAWDNAGRPESEYDLMCPVMDPRCVRVRNLVCGGTYMALREYDSNPSDPGGNPFSYLKVMCDTMRDIQLNTDKCPCEDWDPNTISRVVVPSDPDSDDCVVVRLNDGTKVFQTNPTRPCELHCSVGYIPSPPERPYLSCPAAFSTPTTTLQSCEIGQCGSIPDITQLDTAFSSSCVGQNHGTICNVQCNQGFAISGSGQFMCKCITDCSSSVCTQSCTWNTYGQTCESTLQSCADFSVSNSDRDGQNPLTGYDPIDVTCNQGYSGGGTFTCDQSTLTWLGNSCEPLSCPSTSIANSDRDSTNPLEGDTGTTIEVVCDSDHTGGGTFTCQPDMTWSGVECTAIPECVLILQRESNPFYDLLFNRDCYNDVIKKCIDGERNMRCKETTPSDHNVWLTEMKNKCDQMFLNEGRHAAVYGKLQFTWNRGPVEIECWRVYETYYGCGTLNEAHHVKTCGLQPQLIRSQIDRDQPTAGCTRSGIDVEVDLSIPGQDSNNCVFTSWFDTYVYDESKCKDFEDEHFCNAAIDEWGTSDCFTKWKFWSSRGLDTDDYEAFCPVMDARCVRVRNLVCDQGYMAVSAYDSNPSNPLQSFDYLNEMCTHMTSVQSQLNTDKCPCQDWLLNTISNIASPPSPDSDDCVMTVTSTGEKVYQVNGQNQCELHCAVGYIPEPPAASYLMCGGGYDTATTSMQSCNIGTCGPSPQSSDVAGLDVDFSNSCSGQNHGTFCSVQCQPGLVISGSGQFQCKCITSMDQNGGYVQTCTWNTFSQTCESGTTSCSNFAVTNSDRDVQNPLTGYEPTTVTCNAGYGGSPTTRQWTCDQVSLSWSGPACDANSCFGQQVPNSDRAEDSNRLEGTTGTVLSVTCNLGHSGGGDWICQTNGQFTGASCDPIPCTPEEVPFSNRDASDPLSGNFGTSLLVNCNPGFEGGGQWVCGESGIFTGESCSRISCRTTTVPNSDRDTSNPMDGVFGDAQNVVCIQGYEGGGDWICGADGSFSGTLCSQIQCPGTHVENSELYSPGQQQLLGPYSTIIFVQCSSGYEGSTNYVCQSDGSWRPNQGNGVCTPIQCESNVAISDTNSVSLNGIFGDQAEVTCSEGYGGGGTFRCVESGTFEGTPCTALSCPNQTVHNSDRVPPSNELNGVVGDTTQVRCIPGFVGGGAYRCMADLTWSGTPCTPRPCEAVRIAFSNEYANQDLTGFYGNTFDVTCEVGYCCGGSWTCEMSGTFEGDGCTANSCSPTFVSNSVTTASVPLEGSTGTVINVECAQGFSGGGDWICTTSGTFEGTQCGGDNCQSVIIPNSVEYSSTPLTGVEGDSITVECQIGYLREATGQSNWICDGGIFTGPSCVPRVCNSRIVENSNYSSTELQGSVGDTQVVKCDMGFSASQNPLPVWTCEAQSLNWVGSSCNANPCSSTEDPVLFSNFFTKVNSLQLPPLTGQKVDLLCDSGYAASPQLPPQAVCDPDGFIRGYGTCLPLPCNETFPYSQDTHSNYEELSTASAYAANMTTGDIVLLNCDHGFSPRSSSLVEMYCDINQMLKMTTFCDALPCTGLDYTNLPDHISNVAALEAWALNSKYGDTFQLSCDQGYIQNSLSGGPLMGECSDVYTSGKVTVTGTCIPVPCSHIDASVPYSDLQEVLDNMAQNGNYLRTGGTMQLDCNPGYEGNATIVCGADGFIRSNGSCEAAQCGNNFDFREIPYSNAVNIVELWSQHDALLPRTGDIVQLQCNQGFEGTPSVRCESDGVIRSRGTSCMPLECTSSFIQNSNHDEQNPLQGGTLDIIDVLCVGDYNGGGNWTCDANTLEWQGNGCHPPSCACEPLQSGHDYCYQATRIYNPDRCAAELYCTWNCEVCEYASNPSVPNSNWDQVVNDLNGQGETYATYGNGPYITCNDGFVGGGFYRCQQNGTLSGTPCTLAGCNISITDQALPNSNFDSLMQLRNNYLDFSEELNGVQCNQGFEPYGTVQLTCSETGMINTEVLTCNEAKCNSIRTHNIPNIYPYEQCDLTASGAQCEVTCDSGYFHSGSMVSATCFQGTWTNLANIQCEDSCSVVNCENGGTCMNGQCYCTPNFYGQYCSHPYDDCYVWDNSLIGSTTGGSFVSPGNSIDNGNNHNYPNVCQNGNCTNLDRIMYGISNYTCECDLGWYFNVTTGACTNKKPCPANTFGPDLLSGCECDNMAGYFGSGVTLNSSDCNPICRLENLCIDGGCFNAVHGQVWFDGDTVELQCLHGYRGGGLYTCNVASSPYMKGTAQCTENVCGAYTLPTNVIGGDTDPCTTGIQLSPILDHECHVKCAPGFSGTPATISCLLNSVNGEYPSGSITCTRAYCDVPNVPNSNFNALIQPYLPRPPHDLVLNVSCVPKEMKGGGEWRCNNRTNTFEGEQCVQEDTCGCFWDSRPCGNEWHGSDNKEECEEIDIDGHSCEWTCETNETDSDALINQNPEGSSSSTSFEWMVRIPSYFTVTTIVTSLLMAPMTRHFGIVDDFYIAGLGLSQSILMTVFVAQQVSFSLHTKAGMLGSVQREELDDFSDSWDIFTFKAIETPFRGEESSYPDAILNSSKVLSNKNSSSTNSTEEEDHKLEYLLPSHTAADLRDALFWYLIIMLCLVIVRAISYTMTKTLDVFPTDHYLGPAPIVHTTKHQHHHEDHSHKRRSLHRSIDIERLLSAPQPSVESLEKEEEDMGRNENNVPTQPPQLFTALMLFPRLEIITTLLFVPALTRSATLKAFTTLSAISLLFVVIVFVLYVLFTIRSIETKRRSTVIRKQWQDYNQNEHMNSSRHQPQVNLSSWQNSRSTAALMRSSTSSIELVSFSGSSPSRESEQYGELSSPLPPANISIIARSRARFSFKAGSALGSSISSKSHDNYGDGAKKNRLNFTARYGDMGFVNFKSKRYFFCILVLLYNVVYAALTGVLKISPDDQVYLIICVEILFYTFVLVLQPYLDRSSLNQFCIIAGFVMRILSCVFMLGLIPESDVEKKLGVTASADLLIVVQTVLILLTVLPLFVMYTILPLIALLSYNEPKIIEEVEEIEVLPPAPKKKYEPVAHQIKVVVLELDGLLTKVRDPKFKRCFDFNENLISKLAKIESEAKLSSIPIKYFVLEKNHLFIEPLSGATSHSSTVNLNKIERTQIGTTVVNWRQKETAFDDHLVDVYVNKHTQRASYIDPTSLRNSSWLETKYVISGQEQSYYLPIVPSTRIVDTRGLGTSTSFVEDTSHITRQRPSNFDSTAKRITNAVTLRLSWNEIRLTHVPYLDKHDREVDAGMLRPSLSMMMQSSKGRVSTNDMQRRSSIQTDKNNERELMLESLFDYVKNNLVDREKRVVIIHVGRKNQGHDAKEHFDRDFNHSIRCEYRFVPFVDGGDLESEVFKENNKVEVLMEEEEKEEEEKEEEEQEEEDISKADSLSSDQGGNDEDEGNTLIQTTVPITAIPASPSGDEEEEEEEEEKEEEEEEENASDVDDFRKGTKVERVDLDLILLSSSDEEEEDTEDFVDSSNVDDDGEDKEKKGDVQVTLVGSASDMIPESDSDEDIIDEVVLSI